VPPGAGDAAVIRIKGIAQGLGMTSDCNSRYCYLDPYQGAMIAVAEAARNLVCVGADPAAVTDCLNFGKPEKPDRFWQLKRAVEGIADACRAFCVPVVSGNVSLYNEGPEAAVFPTPTIGMVGVLDKVEEHCTTAFKAAGHRIAFVGETLAELGGSEFLALAHGLEAGMPPALDLDRELKVQALVLQAIRTGLIASAHDCSEGGIAVTLAECALAAGRGFDVTLDLVDRPDLTLFAESQSRVILSVPADKADALAAMAVEYEVPCAFIGAVTEAPQAIVRIDGATVIDLPVADLATAHRTPIYTAMGE
jgi:phosphoribosylformylglycinamidine synthase